MGLGCCGMAWLRIVSGCPWDISTEEVECVCERFSFYIIKFISNEQNKTIIYYSSSLSNQSSSSVLAKLNKPQQNNTMADEQNPQQQESTKHEKKQKKPMEYVTNVFKVPFQTIAFWLKGAPQKERMDSSSHPQPQ
jgi:hypothetical protein